MSTKICCIGAGYVGGPTCAVIAYKCPNVDVTIADLNADRIKQWNGFDLPFFEPGLKKIVSECTDKNLKFTTDIEKTISEADIIFIAVNTPTKMSGVGAGCAADLSYFESAVRTIARCSNSNKIIVEKSTVPCGTANKMKYILNNNGKPGVRFDILSNPEFLAEGTAIENLLNPDRVIIGSELTDDGIDARNKLVKIYENWIEKDKIITTSIQSSELSKLAANALLAQRISSINSLSIVCESIGADIDEVAKACGMDSRIGSKFLKASVGFGGSCFRKDVLNLSYICEQFHLNEVSNYWKSVLNINDYQKRRFSSKIIHSLFGSVSNKKICILGFSFKKDTSDTRESPAIDIVKHLLDDDAGVTIYDPHVTSNQIENDITSSYNDKSSIFLTAESIENKLKFSDISSYNDCVENPTSSLNAGLLTPNPSIASFSDDDSYSSRGSRFSRYHITSHQSNPNLLNPSSIHETNLSLKSFSISPSPPQQKYQGTTKEGHLVSSSSVIPKYKMLFDKNVQVINNIYEACCDCDAMVIITEWDEFKFLDFEKIYSSMRKPAFLFDGRSFLNHEKLCNIGFQVHSIGKTF